MIKVRVIDDLRPGLNASAECRHGHTVVYLMPGLTPAQRRAALRRLRQQGRMDLGPRLPLRELAVALALFRIRRAMGQVGAIVRLHPAGSAVPLLTLAAVVSVFVLTSVQVRIMPSPQAVGGGALADSAPTPTPGTSGQLGPPRLPGAVGSTPGGASARSGPASAPAVAPSTGTSSSGTGGNPLTSGAASSPPPIPTVRPSAATSTAAHPSSAPPPSQAPPPSPTPSPSGQGAAGGNCLTLGPLQICITL